MYVNIKWLVVDLVRWLVVTGAGQSSRVVWWGMDRIFCVVDVCTQANAWQTTPAYVAAGRQAMAEEMGRRLQRHIVAVRVVCVEIWRKQALLRSGQKCSLRHRATRLRTALPCVVRSTAQNSSPVTSWQGTGDRRAIYPLLLNFCLWENFQKIFFFSENCSDEPEIGLELRLVTELKMKVNCIFGNGIISATASVL